MYEVTASQSASKNIMIAVQHEEDQCGWQCLDCMQVETYAEFCELEGTYPHYDFYITEHDFTHAERVVYANEDSFELPTVLAKHGIRAMPSFDPSGPADQRRTTAHTFFNSIPELVMTPKPYETLTKVEYNALKSVGVLTQLYPQATGDYDSDFARTIVIKTTVHGSKETYYDRAQDAGIDNIDALRDFSYAGYEHVMEYEVNSNTGKSKLIAVDGRKLADA